MNPDDERLEQIKEWWKEYRWTIIGGVSLGIASLLGFNFWTKYQVTQAEAASYLYEQVTIQVAAENFIEADQFAQQLLDEYPKSGYAGQTALLRARVQHELGDTDKSRELLHWAIDNAKEDSSVHAARIRLARLLIADSAYDDALKVLDVSDPSGFASHYHELRGDAHRGLNQLSKAREEYEHSLENLPPSSNYRTILTLKLNDSKLQNAQDT